MKDNLEKIWHKHDGKGMPVYLERENFEVRFRDGSTALNHRQDWAWAYYFPEKLSVKDVVAWRYILSDSWNKTGPLTAQELGWVNYNALDGAVFKAYKKDWALEPLKTEIQDERLTKYQKRIRGKDQNGNVVSVVVDVYDVLTAWEVQNPALQHLIKKALQPGERGHKSLEDDLKDIIASAQRALELAKGDMK